MQSEVQIARLQDNKTFANMFTAPQEIAPLATYTSPNLTDGIYRFTITRTGSTTQNFIIAADCNLQRCMEALIRDIVNNGWCCDNCTDHRAGLFNSIMLMFYQYYNSINDEYNFNYLYTALEPSKIEELFNLSRLQQRLTEHCTECKNLTVVSGCGDCGETTRTNTQKENGSNTNTYY